MIIDCSQVRRKAAKSSNHKFSHELRQLLEFEPVAGEVADRIRHKLSGAFSPKSLEVIDESHLHEGHAGARPGGQSHFRVKIVADAFKGRSLVQRHRMVNQTLAEELAGPVHALAISAAPPES